MAVTGGSMAEAQAKVGYCAGELLLGKYRLERPLAAGGMGEVWRAQNELLGSPVAIKLMLGDGGHSDVTLVRARLEARLASRVEHPAVCRALDFGISDRGDPVLVSELLQGVSLDELLRRRLRLPATYAAQILIPVLDGLSAAHEQHIVHRDVKPSNIFIARGTHGQTQPKLLDFGIARSTVEAQRLTRTGLLTGTPDYMSPEQGRGSKDIDARSDVWSACATLYELVSGRSPFPGDNYNAVIFAVLNDCPAPLRELAAAERDLSAVIERGLIKDREQRTPSARQLADELTLFLLQRGVEVDATGHSLHCRTRRGPTERATRARVRWAALSLLAIPPLIAAGWFWSRTARTPQPIEQAAGKPSHQVLAAPLPRPQPLPLATATATAVLLPTLPQKGPPRAATLQAAATASSALAAPSGAAQVERGKIEAPRANSLGYDFGL